MCECEYSFIENPIPDEIDRITNLYRRENWWKQEGDNPEMVRLIIAGSHCFLVARHGDIIVGMGRAVSDSASDAYLQDVTVMYRSVERESGPGSWRYWSIDLNGTGYTGSGS